jgi:transposase-like protein
MYSSKSGSVRRRRTPEQRRRVLVRFHKSQMTLRDFAVRHGIGMSTLSKWLRVESEATSPPVKFQEVTLPNMPLRYAVEVVSPQRWTVRLQNYSEIQSLSQLLQALPC